ncbi:hypothetical protein MCW_00550 [Cardidatus Bartonella washoeensis 085-0475]|uniref:Uncharacterized protein n=1 Tax=Cardidatus Bartonella washoeensis 085-0475 TaxID=1094564 RepID=J0ZCC7_9HYPH|nr:hypothetical protein MCW_00550 [Bartonella washoeensis 085-0475]
MKHLLTPTKLFKISDKVHFTLRLLKFGLFKTHVFLQSARLPHGVLIYQHKFTKANVQEIAFGSILSFRFILFIKEFIKCI